MSKRITLAGLALVAAALLAAPTPALAKGKDGDTVVAIVNGDKILKKQVEEAMDFIPQLKTADEGAKARVFSSIVDEIVKEKLINEATQKAKIQDDPEYKKRLRVLEEQLAKQLYIEKFLDSKITDKEVKNVYEDFKKENVGKKELRARQILVGSEDEAKKVIKQLDDGKKFEEVARKTSSGPSAQNGGEIPGFFAQDEMVPEIGKAAFATKAGEYTKEPVHTQFGWHVIKVEEVRPRKVPALDEIKDNIRSRLAQEALAEMTTDLRKKADIKIFDSEGKPIAQ